MTLFSQTEASAQQAEWPQTRAERTQYRETSHYDDVMRFLEQLQAKGAPITIETIGVSAGGKKIPLVIAARPPVASALEARRRGKVVVYLQANIHGGEVEGKEAVQMLLRQIAQEDKKRWLDKLVLLVTPIYNVDGNEKFGDARRNRGSQDGPDPVVERANGQGFDHNRDSMKAETPEMRAALRHIYTAWEPDVMMDLHTTNGTRHGFHLTYAPPLNPDTEAGILKYSRDELLPTLRRRLHNNDKFELFDYGNVEGRGEQRAWRTVGPEPRYMTNYVGLRNRIALLSEAASFLPFQTRVDSTLRFVEGVLDETTKHAARILKMTREADARVVSWGEKPETAPALGVRYEMAQRGVEPIPLEKPRPAAEIDRRKAPTDMETLTLPVFDRFRATRTAKFPAAYLIPAAHANVVELLRRHGVAVERLTAEWRGPVEEFAISERVVAPQGFQNHRLNRLEGRFETTQATCPAGDYLVRTAQPLGILLFHLLEPESLDGVAAWNFLDDALAAPGRYPIRKTCAPVRVPSVREP
jgi:hypothetical protein